MDDPDNARAGEDNESKSRVRKTIRIHRDVEERLRGDADMQKKPEAEIIRALLRRHYFP